MVFTKSMLKIREYQFLFYCIKQIRMYLECVLISSLRSQADEEAIKLQNELRLNSLKEVYANKPYHSRIQTDKRYIDSPLTAKSRSGNAELKTKVKVYEPQIVLVSPQKKALQTCLDIFGDSDNVLIYVEPRLAERVSSTSAIGSDIEEIVKKFKHLPVLEQWQHDPNWYLSNIKQQKNCRTEGDPQQQAFKLLSDKSRTQSHDHYYNRLSDLKNDLVHYNAKTKNRLALVACGEVLEALTSTSINEDKSLVNAIRFDFGEVKPEYLWIEEYDGELENSSMPFCS